MRTYKFENIKNNYVVGDCHGDIKTLLNSIKMGLSVKPDDEEPLHPMEIERLARKAAMESRRRGLVREDGGHGMRLEGLRAFNQNERFEPELTSRQRTIGKALNKYKKELAIYSNTLFIITGDSGIGCNEQKYYDELFAKYNKVLEYNNSFVVFIRGNHDDPTYFDGERINLSNIKAIPDYSVIQIGNRNILCVGGAISIDRMWRMKQQDRINAFGAPNKKHLYWKNEAPVFDKEAICEIAKEMKINCVVSHSAPSFINQDVNDDAIDNWIKDDVTLSDDIKEERNTMDRVFECLRDNNTKPAYWAYSHFDYLSIEKRSDTIFRGLGDGFSPVSIDFDFIQFQQMEENKKKKTKAHKQIKIATPLMDNNPFDNEGHHGEYGVLGAEDEHGDDLPDFADEGEREEDNGNELDARNHEDGIRVEQANGGYQIDGDELRQTIERINREVHGRWDAAPTRHVQRTFFNAVVGPQG